MAYDLIGQKFGEWTVLKRSEKKSSSGIIWTCQCSCGLVKDVLGTHLINHHSTKCKSCANRQSNVNHNKIKDISNQQYKYFIVISYHHSTEKKVSCWLCKCQCGNYFTATKTQIQLNENLNCGCIKIKSLGEQKIQNILDTYNITYQMEYSFSNLKDKKQLRFDFAIFDNNNNLIKLIEFQGKQHYEINSFYISPKEHDELKRKYCKEHNIELLEIPYWDYDKIDINYLLD